MLNEEENYEDLDELEVDLEEEKEEQLQTREERNREKNKNSKRTKTKTKKKTKKVKEKRKREKRGRDKKNKHHNSRNTEKKDHPLILLFLVLLFLVGLGYFLYMMYFKEENKKDQNNPTVNKNETTIKGDQNILSLNARQLNQKITSFNDELGKIIAYTKEGSTSIRTNTNLLEDNVKNYLVIKNHSLATYSLLLGTKEYVFTAFNLFQTGYLADFQKTLGISNFQVAKNFIAENETDLQNELQELESSYKTTQENNILFLKEKDDYIMAYIKETQASVPIIVKAKNITYDEKKDTYILNMDALQYSDNPEFQKVYDTDVLTWDEKYNFGSAELIFKKTDAGYKLLSYQLMKK